MCAYCERDHAYERAKKASAAARAEKAKELEEKVKKSSQEKTEAKVALDKIMAKFAADKKKKAAPKKAPRVEVDWDVCLDVLRSTEEVLFMSNFQ